jgi:choline-glycine betaine transporter
VAAGPCIINMVLSFFLLTCFLIFGSTFFGLQALYMGIFDYVVALVLAMFD